MNYPPRYLRERNACDYLGIRRTKFRELVRNGALSQPYKVGRCNIWRTTELELSFDTFVGAANDNTRAGVLDSWSDLLDGAGMEMEASND